MMDMLSKKRKRAEIAMIKVAVPKMACQVISWAIQPHGGGTSDGFVAGVARRLLCLDRPDAMLRNQRRELKKHSKHAGGV